MGDADHQADALPLRRLWELVATADQRQPFARLPRARRWTFSCLLLPATAEREGLWWEGTRGPHAHAIDLEPCVQSRRTASCYLLYCDSAFHAAAPCTGLWETLLVGARLFRRASQSRRLSSSPQRVALVCVLIICGAS